MRTGLGQKIGLLFRMRLHSSIRTINIEIWGRGGCSCIQYMAAGLLFRKHRNQVFRSNIFLSWAFCFSSWVAMFSSSSFFWNAGEPPFRLSLRESQARPCDSEADACTFFVKALAFQSGTAREPGHALQHRTCAPRHLFH